MRVTCDTLVLDLEIGTAREINDRVQRVLNTRTFLQTLLEFPRVKKQRRRYAHEYTSFLETVRSAVADFENDKRFSAGKF